MAIKSRTLLSIPFLFLFVVSLAYMAVNDFNYYSERDNRIDILLDKNEKIQKKKSVPPPHCKRIPEPEASDKSLTYNVKSIFATTMVNTEPKSIIVTDNLNTGNSIVDHLQREYISYKVLNNILHSQDRSEIVQFIDAGSNHGVFSVDAALNGATHVYAIEPQPQLRQRMRSTFRLNDVDKIVQIFGNAVLDKDETIQLTNMEGDGGVAHININGKSSGQSINVETMRIDCLPVLQGPIAAMKMDIEGFELFGLESSKAFFNEKRVKNVLVEFGPPSRWIDFNNGTAADGVEMMKKMHDVWEYDLTILPSIGYDYMKKSGLTQEMHVSGVEHLLLPRENYDIMKHHLEKAGELFVWWKLRNY